MRQILYAIGFAFVLGSVPAHASAAYTFSIIDTDHLYLQSEQNSASVAATKSSLYAFWDQQRDTCASVAAANGLDESGTYWCLQKVVAVGGSFGCVFGGPNCNWDGNSSMCNPWGCTGLTTSIYTSYPASHPMSYFTTASESQKTAMLSDRACGGTYGADWAYADGCDLWKHTPPVAPPSATLAANPSAVTAGSTSGLTWSCGGVITAASIDQGIGSLSPSGTTWSGTVSSGPLNETKTYTLTCTNAVASATATAVVTVGPPSAPTNLAYSCNTAGTEAVVSWTPGAGTTQSLFRFDDPTNNSTSCVDGWYCAEPPDKALSTTANTVTISIVPNRSYTWWVHSVSGAGTSAATSAGFSCPNASQLSCSVSNSNPAVGESVRFTASGGSPSYTWTFAEGGSQTTSLAYLDRIYATAGTYGVTLSKSGYSSDTCPLVTVGSPCGSTAVDLIVQQSRVKTNTVTYLNWTIPSVESGVTSCVVTSSAQPSWNRIIPIATCGVAVTGTGATHPVTAQTTFTLTCGSRTDTAIVNIIPVIDEV